MNLKGAITALVTPFLNGKLDEEGLIKNIRFQIEQGINGIVALGSTGETPTLSYEEQERVMNLAIREGKGKVPVWIGTGSYCTKTTIEKTRHAQEAGADVALIVTPYYNRPTQDGLFRHYEAIATQVDIPIVVYNVQVRCAVNLETATLLRIAALPNIVGVKEASGSVSQAGDVIKTVVGRYPDFLVFSGDDALALPTMALGGDGIISVVSNLIPAQVVAQANAMLRGDLAEARAIHHRLLPFYKTAFIETNPAPIKAAMNLCGMAAGECRLPLAPLLPENHKILRQLVEEMKRDYLEAVC